MRLKPEKIDQLAALVYAALKDIPELTFNGEKNDITAAIAKVIEGDLREEDELDVEAQKLLDLHADDLRRTGASTAPVLRKIKDKLARDRGFTL